MRYIYFGSGIRPAPNYFETINIKDMKGKLARVFVVQETINYSCEPFDTYKTLFVSFDKKYAKDFVDWQTKLKHRLSYTKYLDEPTTAYNGCRYFESLIVY